MHATKPSPLDQGQALASRVAELMDETKLENVLVLDLRGIASFADYFVLGTARSGAQMGGAARKIHETLKAEGISPAAPVEDESSRWTILDYGDVVAHLFDDEARRHYRLEEVWGDAPEVEWRGEGKF